jgi:hypothetical protein
MNYTQLNEPAYRHAVIAEAVHAREVEHWHYAFDAQTFERLLQTEPEGAYRADLTKRLEETRVQMGRVEQIRAALLAQVTDPAAYAQACRAAAAKRELQEQPK